MGHSKKVTIQVGFISIATRMEVAVDSESSDTHTVCIGTDTEPHDPTRVRQSVACTSCGIKHSSSWGFPHRGAERDGKLVVLTQEELTQAAGTPITGRADGPPVKLCFHPREKVFGATVAADSVQSVYPDRGGEKAYAILRDTLAATPDVVATMIWAPGSKNALWVLDVIDQRIVASKRHWPENVRPTLAVPEVEVLDKERELFTELIRASVTDFDLLEYQDQAKTGLGELIASRVEVATPLVAELFPAVDNDQRIDMLAAIQASLNAAQPTRRPAKKAAKKTTAKKAPAKKTTARKRAAKKVA